MILVIILFILVFLISFFLALYSMRDFQHTPSKRGEYGVFLVKNLNNLNQNSLSAILTEAKQQNFLISFEKLFKGSESALAIFAPRLLLSKFNQLNLLELEDYTNENLTNMNIWEAEIRDTKSLKINLPKLALDERIWIQAVVKNNVQLRIIAYSQNLERLKQITGQFQTNFKNSLPKWPKPYSKTQLFEFYKTRSFIKGEKTVKLNVENILNLCLFL